MNVRAANVGDTVLSHGGRANRAVVVLVWSYLPLWFLGLGGIFWVLSGLISLLFLLGGKLSVLGRLSLFVGLCIGASSLIGFMAFGFSFDRLLGLLANICVWLSVAVAVSLRPKAGDVARLTRAILWISVVQGALSVIALVMYPTRLPIPLMHNFSDSMPSGMAAFAEDRLAVESWLGGVAFRSAGLNGNPTWSGAFAAVALIVAIHLLVRNQRGQRLLAACASVLSIFSIYMSLSRSAWVLMGVVGIYFLLAHVNRRFRVLGHLMSAIVVVCGIVALLLRGGEVLSWLQELEGQREGSSASRGAIYERTWGYVADLPLALFGYGIKPQSEELVASVASHSTYLGLLFRAGLIGLLFFVAFVVILLVSSLRTKSVSATSVVLFIALWCVLEDYDTGHLLPLGIIWASWMVHLSVDNSSRAGDVGPARSTSVHEQSIIS